MADNADFRGVHFRQIGEEIGADRPDIGEIHQRLALDVGHLRFTRVAAGRTDHQGDKTTVGEGLRHVAEGMSVGGSRFAVGGEDKHRGMRAGSLGNPQAGEDRLSRGDIDSQALLGHPILHLGFENVERTVFPPGEAMGPGYHSSVGGFRPGRRGQSSARVTRVPS